MPDSALTGRKHAPELTSVPHRGGADPFARLGKSNGEGTSDHRVVTERGSHDARRRNAQQLAKLAVDWAHQQVTVATDAAPEDDQLGVENRDERSYCASEVLGFELDGRESCLVSFACAVKDLLCGYSTCQPELCHGWDP